MSMIKSKIDALKDSEFKLLLIVGRPGTGKSKMIQEFSEDTGVPIIDMNKILGEKIPVGKDSNYVYGFLKGFLSTYKQKYVLLDKKRILYSSESNIDLIEFLKDISRDKYVVATWNGYVDDGKLIHIRSDQKSNLEYDLASLECATILL